MIQENLNYKIKLLSRTWLEFVNDTVRTLLLTSSSWFAVLVVRPSFESDCETSAEGHTKSFSSKYQKKYSNLHHEQFCHIRGHG